MQLKNIFCLTVTLIGICFAGIKANSTPGNNTARLSDSNRFVFNASIAQPMGSRQILLQQDYFGLILTADSLNVYLPYYGTATNVSGYDLSANNSPLTFATNNFKITQQKNTKKSSVTMVIQPFDQSVIRTITIQYFNEGNTIINVQFVNRQPISFIGNGNYQTK